MEEYSDNIHLVKSLILLMAARAITDQTDSDHITGFIKVKLTEQLFCLRNSICFLSHSEHLRSGGSGKLVVSIGSSEYSKHTYFFDPH